MIINEIIETNRLVLRSLNDQDVSKEYLFWLRDPSVNKYLEIRFSKSIEKHELVNFINSMNNSADNLLLGIFLKKNNSHIGNIKLGPIIQEHCRSEIGFLIGEKTSWGKGYASEAISALSEYALNTLNLKKITAGCYEENIGSQRALEKAGFRLEATIPNHVVFNKKRISSLLFGYQD